MKARVYVLLEIENNRLNEADNILRLMPGVRSVDTLEGSPNMIIALQARNRRQLATLTNRALESIEDITENIQLFTVPVNGGEVNDEIMHKKNILPDVQAPSKNEGTRE